MSLPDASRPVLRGERPLTQTRCRSRRHGRNGAGSATQLCQQAVGVAHLSSFQPVRRAARPKSPVEGHERLCPTQNDDPCALSTLGVIGRQLDTPLRQDDQSVVTPS